MHALVQIRSRFYAITRLFVWRTTGVSLFRKLWAWYYKLGTSAFLRLCRTVERSCGAEVIEAIYLRRGGGRGELVAGASDLDFFLVLKPITSETETAFVTRFWDRYFWVQHFFPFWGETLIADENELRNWLSTSTVRAWEVPWSWKLLSGKSMIHVVPAFPSRRDLFSEGLKCYWEVLQSVLVLSQLPRKMNGEASLGAGLRLRNAIKATVDILRFEASAVKREESQDLWQLPRGEILQRHASRFSPLPTERLLRILRTARSDDTGAEAGLRILKVLVQVCLESLERISQTLSTETGPTRDWKMLHHTKPGVADPYPLSVRELFAERILVRNPEGSRVILSRNSAWMLLCLKKLPPQEAVDRLVQDFFDASQSLDRFCIPMVATEAMFRQIEQTSLLDSPFHSFYEQEEVRLGEQGQVEVRDFTPGDVAVYEEVLRKTVAELSFVLRIQPRDFHYFLEKVVALVLSLRVATETQQVVTDLTQVVALFEERFALRGRHFRTLLSRVVHFETVEEAKIWQEMFRTVEEFSDPDRAHAIRIQLENERAKRLKGEPSPTLVTDFWTDLLPFLRMEMNALKDRFFSERPRLTL